MVYCFHIRTAVFQWVWLALLSSLALISKVLFMLDQIWSYIRNFI